MDRQRSHPFHLVLRHLPLVAAASALLAAACAGQSGQLGNPARRSEVVLLPGAPASNYTTESPTGGAVLDDPGGALAEAFRRAMLAREAPLIGDRRLTLLSRFIADHVSPEGTLPSQAAIDTAARHLGLVEPTPHFVVVGTDAEEGVEERLQEDIDALLAERAYSHYGGVAQHRGGISLYVAALVFRFLELEPVPRRIEPGRAIKLAGTLTHGHTAPELAVTEPNGKVVRGTPTSGSELRFRVPAKTRGVYRVEVLGQGPQGITVVANFPVYVGEDPPERVEIATQDSGPVDPDRAAQVLLGMVNEERAKAQLAPLVLDDALSRIADAHVSDMIDAGFVAHTSKTTGSAADRVARAGIRTSIVLENIGRGYSLREVHEGLLASPGHRGNILNELVTHIGIGVRASPESGHTAYLVTELYTRVTPKLTGDAAEVLLDKINEKRRALGRPALTENPALSALARKTAQGYFKEPVPSDGMLMQGVRAELERLQVPARTVGALLTVASSLEELADLDAVHEPGTKLIGIGLAQGSRSDAPANALCAVVLLGQ
jgi:uncharacterized protein YkwD